MNESTTIVTLFVWIVCFDPNKETFLLENRCTDPKSFDFLVMAEAVFSVVPLLCSRTLTYWLRFLIYKFKSSVWQIWVLYFPIVLVIILLKSGRSERLKSFSNLIEEFSLFWSGLLSLLWNALFWITENSNCVLKLRSCNKQVFRPLN